MGQGQFYENKTVLVFLLIYNYLFIDNLIKLLDNEKYKEIRRFYYESIW